MAKFSYLFIFLSALLIEAPAALAAHGEPPSAVRMKGRGTLFGPMSVEASPVYLKVQAKEGYMLWSRETPGQVKLVNPENKTYLPVPLQEWLNDTREEVPDVLPFEKTETVTVKVAGLPLHRSSCYRLDKVGGRELVLEYYSLPGWTTNSGGEKLWDEALGVKNCSEFPVGVSQLCLKRRHHKTNGESKAARFRQLISPMQVEFFKPDAKTFAIPPGYKQAKDRAALYLSTGGELKPSDIDDLFRGELK